MSNFKNLLKEKLKEKASIDEHTEQKRLKELALQIQASVINKFESDPKFYHTLFNVSDSSKLKKISHNAIVGLLENKESRLYTQNYISIYLGYKDYTTFLNENEVKVTRTHSEFSKSTADEFENINEKNKTGRKKLYILVLVSLVIFLVSTFILLFYNPFASTQKIETIPVLEQVSKDSVIRRPKKLFGTVVDNFEKPIKSVNLNFTNLNYKCITNEFGNFTIKDSLIIFSILTNKANEIILTHKNYLAAKYIINENVFMLNNDSISKIELFKKQKPIKGTQININEIVNQDNGIINIGPTTINKITK